MKSPLSKHVLGLTFILASSAVPLSSVHAEGEPTNWRYTEKNDPIMGRTNVSAKLSSDDGGSTFSIVCNGLAERYVSLQFMPKGFLGSSDNIVIFKVDDRVPVPSSSWTYAARGAYTVSSDVLKLFASMVGPGENHLVVRALNYEDQPVDASFHSINAAAAYAHVRAACGDAPG